MAMIAGCAGKDDAAPAAADYVMAATLPQGFQTSASILDLMLYPIDPLADELWEAVAIVSTATGTEEIHPQTDEEWATLRTKALLLMESGNLLVTQGRQVGHPGQKIEGLGESTDLTPEQAQAEIDKDRASLVAFSLALQAAAGGLRDAIDARSIDDYLTAGSLLQEACEGCHRKFWYPNSVLPPGL
jgi:hypothetical protein